MLPLADCGGASECGGRRACRPPHGLLRALPPDQLFAATDRRREIERFVDNRRYGLQSIASLEDDLDRGAARLRQQWLCITRDFTCAQDIPDEADRIGFQCLPRRYLRE
jgi:hypothetical protein